MTATSPLVIPLWPEGAPGSESWTHQEQESVAGPPDNVPIVRNVTQPTLAVFLPAPSIATGTGVIIAPGGAFHILAIEHEGTQVARWLTERGFAAFLLKYRLWPTPTSDADWPRPLDQDSMGEVTRQILPLAVADGRQAVKIVRERAGEWGLAPNRIGMLGFSAGGHVTARIALEQDPASRLEFAAVIYGVLREEVVAPPDASPLFILLATDDDLAVDSCLHLYSAWRSADRRVELHSFAAGGHGFGMKPQGLPVDRWIELFEAWLRQQGR